MTDSIAPNASRFAPLAPEAAQQWAGFPNNIDRPMFAKLVGLKLEEVRQDYARMRLPYRPELEQPAGIMHGGAIATLIDVVVVPAVASSLLERRMLFTVDMHVSYLAPIANQDAIAEGWVEKRGRSTVFCRVEVRTASGELASTASLVYKVSSRAMPAPA